MRSPIEVGRRYAYRVKAERLLEPVEEVEVIQKAPRATMQKSKIRHLSGEYEGLDEWVPNRRMVCAWEDVEAFRDMEQKEDYLWEVSEEPDPMRDHAVTYVLRALPQLALYTDHSWAYTIIPSPGEVFPIIEAEFGLTKDELMAEPGAFIHGGAYKAPFELAERIAKLACKKWPLEVMRLIRKEQLELHEALRDTSEWREGIEQKVRREQLPALELAISWCGEEAEKQIDMLDYWYRETRRLEHVLHYLVSWLHDAGHYGKAGFLKKDIERTDGEGFLQPYKPPRKEPCEHCNTEVLVIETADGRDVRVEPQEQLVLGLDGMYRIGHHEHLRVCSGVKPPPKPPRKEPKELPKCIDEVPDHLTISRLRKMFDIPKTTIYNLVSRGVIKTRSSQYLRVRLVTKDEVKRLMETDPDRFRFPSEN
jgi:hypothetical protein